VAYLVHAGVHWDWEMPVLTLAALSCGAAILVVQRPADGGRAFRAPARSGTLAGVFAVGAFTLIGMVGNAAIARSRAAEAVGAPGEAAAHALAATQWMPWSGEPWRLLGEARMDQGDVALARASFQRGLRKDPRSWKLWKDLSLASGGRAKRDAADRAERLNPMGSR